MGLREILEWRRGRDLNPGYPYEVYSLSRGAPSAARPPLHAVRIAFSRSKLARTLPFCQVYLPHSGFPQAKNFTSVFYPAISKNYRSSHKKRTPFPNNFTGRNRPQASPVIDIRAVSEIEFSEQRDLLIPGTGRRQRRQSRQVRKEATVTVGAGCPVPKRRKETCAFSV